MHCVLCCLLLCRLQFSSVHLKRSMPQPASTFHIYWSGAVAAAVSPAVQMRIIKRIFSSCSIRIVLNTAIALLVASKQFENWWKKPSEKYSHFSQTQFTWFIESFFFWILLFLLQIMCAPRFGNKNKGKKSNKAHHIKIGCYKDICAYVHRLNVVVFA